MTDRREHRQAAIEQPAEPRPEAFMRRAEEMLRRAVASGDQAYGAVIVKDGRIVGQAPSRVVVNTDPTGHAETEAIRDAARRLRTRDLGDCLLYTNGGRPCPMCETAAYWAGIRGLRLEGPGGTVVDAGAPVYGGC